MKIDKNKIFILFLAFNYAALTASLLGIAVSDTVEAVFIKRIFIVIAFFAAVWLCRNFHVRLMPQRGRLKSGRFAAALRFFTYLVTILAAVTFVSPYWIYESSAGWIQLVGIFVVAVAGAADLLVTAVLWSPLKLPAESLIKDEEAVKEISG
ncbi:hypothetical protein SMSP2_00959 [Limihaloglobus sulfuriphilus]|uniref:Uncharacterized protein n=1 Tax=Limihaloglobus sulfuriphilus TaxID=1851148 RepID=A0A1Q2MD35_9BACT|nr:hypothetical protein [Limihaloglobus sulfuriphilus]AQQ70605.1 hypothetical protein SMSP2_00959 [Limihaloglobus sulfuriphilus]